MAQRHFFWQSRTLLCHYLINVAVGIMIAVIFAMAAGSQWGEGVRNAAFDLLVRYEYQQTPHAVAPRSPLFFVEISPLEYRQWGEPLLTPREKVADLIDAAWHKGAPVVVLDILLDRPDREHPDADAKLRSLLQRMLRENAHTRVIFPVRVGADGELRGHLLDDFFESRSVAGERLFYPAAPTVLASQVDLLNRFWGAYQVCRDRQGGTRIIWSVALLAAALHQGTQDHLEQLAKRLVAGAGQAHGGATGEGDAELRLKLGERELQLAPLERLAPADAGYPGFQAGESHGLPYAQRVRFLIAPRTLARRDAGNFRPGLSPDSLAGKIVVIGNGSPETGDILATPVGQMPGMYLIGNAINTIVTGRMPEHMEEWQDLLLEAAMIVVAAWLFLKFHTILAQILSSLLFLAALVPVSWYLYREFGVFINFIIPVVGMRLHGIADSLETMFATKGRKQHDHH